MWVIENVILVRLYSIGKHEKKSTSYNNKTYFEFKLAIYNLIRNLLYDVDFFSCFPILYRRTKITFSITHMFLMLLFFCYLYYTCGLIVSDSIIFYLIIRNLSYFRIIKYFRNHFSFSP
jgi:hypothetical protein